jgi:hypothetical protein
MLLTSKPSIRPTPTWDEQNAERHRHKHTKCFERLLGVLGREVTISEFKTRSQRAIDGSWAEFEADKLENGKAAYFVDDDLVQAVTTADRQVFRTCFHQHFDRPRDCESLIAGASGDRRALLIRHLMYGEKGRVYTDVKRIRGV